MKSPCELTLFAEPKPVPGGFAQISGRSGEQKGKSPRQAGAPGLAFATFWLVVQDGRSCAV